MTAPRKIAAIQTHYKGCRFRSRTEARYACFFDAMGWGWDFEPEGFTLPSGRYLPDFRLHHPAGPRWFEVKPFLAEDPTPDDTRWADLARGSGLPVQVAYGLHRTGDGCETAWTARKAWVRHAGRAVLPSGVSALLGPFWTGPGHAAAWDAANGARFEHGESGSGRR